MALNGVPFEPGTAETWNNDRRSGWRYEAHTGFLNPGLAEHHAHVQPTGAYHYHAMPLGLVEWLGGNSNRMLLMGWAVEALENVRTVIECECDQAPLTSEQTIPPETVSESRRSWRGRRG